LKTLHFPAPYATLRPAREFPAVPCQPTDQTYCAAFHFPEVSFLVLRETVLADSLHTEHNSASSPGKEAISDLTKESSNTLQQSLLFLCLL